MPYSYIYSICLFFLLASCSDRANEELSGTWQATAVVQNGQPLDVKLSEITLTFDGDQRYEYTSTLDYKEAGFYKLHGDRLETQDTLQQPPVAKIVIVETLQSDSLKLKMKNETDWIYLTLLKK